MKKIWIIGMLLLLVGSAYAQTPQVAGTPTTLPAAATISNLPTPGITPDSWFYGVKRLWQNIDMALTFNDESKAQKEINYANERLAEVQYLVGQNKLNDAVQMKAEYEQGIKAAENDLAQADSQGKDTTEVRKTIEQQLQRHEDVLTRVISNVNNTNAKAALQEALQNQEQHRLAQIQKLQEIQQIQRQRAENRTGNITLPTVTLPHGAKEGETCGGITGTRCEDRLNCNIQATGTPDATGICVKTEPQTSPYQCGGLTGKQCPDGMTCKIAQASPDAPGYCTEKEGPKTAPTTTLPAERRESELGGVCGGSIGYTCKEGLRCNAPTIQPAGTKPGMTGWDIGRCVKPDVTIMPVEPPKPLVGMANPASIYCTQIGGTINITTDAGGNQGGQCTLPTGAVCEEWALYKGNCGGALGRH